jgi:hypothetical protein
MAGLLSVAGQCRAMLRALAFTVHLNFFRINFTLDTLPDIDVNIFVS